MGADNLALLLHGWFVEDGPDKTNSELLVQKLIEQWEAIDKELSKHFKLVPPDTRPSCIPWRK